MSRETFLERHGRHCASPECGRLYEGPEPYCPACRAPVWAVSIGPDGPYFVSEIGEDWPGELPGPQCPACGSAQGFELTDDGTYGCECGAEYEIHRAPTARVVF